LAIDSRNFLKNRKMKISALDESGKPVDWWFIYKVPKLSAGAAQDPATGYEYVYYDSTIDTNPDKLSRRVALSQFRIDQGTGALNLTLDSVFTHPSASTGWILYNDERPSGAGEARDNANLGHTKGVIAFDTSSGTAYWLLHSWPKFADPDASHEPTPEYGQTYFCVSLDIAAASKLAAQMIDHQEPQTYLNRPAKISANDPLARLMQPIDAKAPGDSDVIDLKSRAGMPFKVIAKNRNWNRDFWNELVGPTLGEDMDDETWIRGKIPPIADSDGVHKTFDIKYINLGALGVHWAWPETHDHAKWGITLHSDWICVGDINRMVSQRKRGGGTIAFQNAVLWKALSQSSFLLAPPGSTRAQAHELISLTHPDPTGKGPPPKKAKVKKRAAGKTPAKKKRKPR
jgi:deoxyribonuclease II